MGFLPPPAVFKVELLTEDPREEVDRIHVECRNTGVKTSRPRILGISGGSNMAGLGERVSWPRKLDCRDHS